MYILVTYDIHDEKVRRRVRALLRKYSFAMLAYSVYIGRGNRGIAERLSWHIARLLGPNDRAVLILLQDFQYELLMDIKVGYVRVHGEEYNIRVFYGKRSSNVGSGRLRSVYNKDKVENRTPPSWEDTERGRG